MSSSDISENIKVFIRQRPWIAAETSSNVSSKVSGIESFSKDFTKCSYFSATNNLTQDFKADKMFVQSSTQDALYDEIARPLVDSALLGYSSTIVAYGPTCSGKTFTMRGGPGDDKGIMPRVIEHLLQRSSSGGVTIWASYVQIYCEAVSDLLSSAAPADGGNGNMSIREKSGSVYVEGLSRYQISSVEDLWSILHRGDDNRNTASTNMNETSSRSHAALMIQLIIADEGDAESTKSVSVAGTHRESTLMLVDLAGSERATASEGRDYMRLEEAKAINLSLSALGNCMSALAEGRAHVPYRDSKLTRLLQGCLGGSSRTAVIVNVPPGEDTTGETLSALRFASRASKVKVTAKVNRCKDYEAMYLEAKRALDQLGRGGGGGSAAEAQSREEALRKKDQQIDNLTVEVESLKKQLQLFHTYSKYATGTASGGGGVGGMPATSESGKVLPLDSAALDAKLSELTERHASEIDAITRTFQARVNQHKNNERQLAAEISQLHDDINRDRQALLAAVQEQRALHEKKQRSENSMKARIDELLSEVNERRTQSEALQESYDALLARHNETAVLYKAAQEAMLDMVTKEQVKEMESLFLDTVTKLSTRVNYLEKAKKASSILTENERQLEQQQAAQRQQRIEPGGKVRVTSLNILPPNSGSSK